jgi:hypothetical protein
MHILLRKSRKTVHGRVATISRVPVLYGVPRLAQSASDVDAVEKVSGVGSTR